MGTIQKAQKDNIGKTEKKEKSIKDYIKLYENQIAKALPSVLTPERFSRMVLTAVSKTPKLAECTPQSFIGSMLTAAQLGLEPNTPLGQAYLIPYGDSCQFQIGYKGLLELVHRSGEIKTLDARCVYENDEFNIEYGLNPSLVHKPTFKNRGTLIGIYAVYHTVNGGYAFEFMSVEDIELHKEKYSKSYSKKDSVWHTDFESMAKKTVIKRLLKYAPLKAEFVKAISNDEQTKSIDFTENNELIILNENEQDISSDEEDINTLYK